MSHAVGWTRRSRAQLLALVVATVVGAPLGAQVNVAQGKPVTLEGTFGVLRPGSTWAPAPPPAPASTVVDGVFRPEETTWTDQTLWWDALAAGSENNAVIIDFGSVFNIASFTLQADDNDYYGLDFRVGASDPWTTLGNFGPAGSFGMITRGQYTAYPFTASQVRLRGVAGDSYYAISEFQAIITTPEPGSMALVATGLLALVAVPRRRRNANVM